MELDKSGVLSDRAVTNQQALVNKLMEKTNPLKRIYIPGGNNLGELIKHKKDLRKAIYTWLRGSRYFIGVTISLSEAPEARDLLETKVKSFDTSQPHPIWVMHDERKGYLADILTEIMTTTKIVKITAKKEGIFIFKDSSDSFGQESSDWLPYIEFTPEHHDQYR